MAWSAKQERVAAQQQRFPPYSREAEEALLGILIYANRTTWKDATKQVPMEMFFDNWHRGLYRWLKSVEGEPWRWNTRSAELTRGLHKAANEVAGYEDLRDVSWRLGRMLNHPQAALDALPGLLKTLRRLMVLRRKIAEAEKSLNEAWRQADAEEC